MRLLGRPARTLPLVREETQGLARVLEVGAGTGLVTVAIASSAAHVVATDYSAAMIQVLEARLARERKQNVECAARDLYDLGYSGQAFDAVVCANVLHLVPDLPRALSCLRDVLRPGGKIIAPTFVHGETVLSRTASRLLAATGFPARRRLTAAKLRGILEEAGFHVYRAKLIPGFIPIAFAAGIMSSKPSTP